MYRSFEEERDSARELWQVEALPLSGEALPKPGASQPVLLECVDSRSKIVADVYHSLSGAVQYKFDSVVGDHGHTRLW